MTIKSLFFFTILLIIYFPKLTYGCDATFTGTSNTQTIVTGTDCNITVGDGSTTTTFTGLASNNRHAIRTTNGIGTTITVKDAAKINPKRYGIVHDAGTGTIQTITVENGGTIEATDSSSSKIGSAIWNYSTIVNIINDGTIESNTRNGIVNGRDGKITKIHNQSNGVIKSGKEWAIKNVNGGEIVEIVNEGSIETPDEVAIRNHGSGSKITLIENKSGGQIKATHNTIQIDSDATITTITNAGTITASGSNGKTIRVGGGTVGTINNSGTISATKNTGTNIDGQAIWVSGSGAKVDNIINSGTISTLQGDGTIYTSSLGTIVTITNSGTISASNGTAGITNKGTITTINNSGTITDATDDGILNEGTITTITNTGTITGGSGTGDVDIKNSSGTITTLNNDQGGNDALTYDVVLPTNYNVIVNSASDYGKIVFSNKSGTTTFGVDSTSTFTGASVNTTYSDVISGLTESDLESCTSDTDCTTGNNFEGTNKYYWKLDDTNGDDDWDLIITSIKSSIPPASTLPKTPTLESMNSLKSVTDANFAHMNTYDCDFFGNNNDSCLSLGARRSEVTNPSSTTDGIVLVAGKKYSDHLRFGGFYHTNTNHNTSKNLKLSDKTPLLGSLIVWNQSRFGLGFQVKYANAYQEKNATITREAGENSEEGTGSTTTSAISNTIETRYILSKKRKINYIPYFAARHAIKTQDSFTEVGPTSPLTYNTIKDEAFTVLLGSRFDSNLTSIFNLYGSLGIEHDIYHTIDKLVPTGMSGLPTVNLDANLKKTRPVVSIGFDYELSSNSRFSGVVQYQELAFESMTQTNTYFYYSMAF